MVFRRLFMNDTQKILCQLLANTLFQEELPADIGNVSNWEEVYQESKRQAVVIPAFLKYDKLLMDKEMKKEIGNSVKMHIFQCVQNYSYHSYLHELMTENGISYCILKGVASSSYYPEEMSRQMGDVDFLVAEKDLESVRLILEKNGFTLLNENHAFHKVYINKGMQLEMHFMPCTIPNGKAGEIIRNYFKDIEKSSVKFQDKTFEFQIPNSFHHGLIMLMHVQRHLVGEGIGLRHLCDWAVFVNTFSEEEFENLFQARLEKAGLWTFAKILSLSATVSIGLPYQKWMGNDVALAEALAKDILSGGNFGVKNSQRVYEGMLISDRGKGDFGHNRAIQFIRTLTQRTCINYPITEKVKIFMPFGCIILCIKNVVKIIKGTRNKVNLQTMYKNSLSRKELYKNLRLFEV